MPSDPYSDHILGDWKFDPKKSKKDQFTWQRQATVKLHKDHHQLWTNPETFKVQKVYGEVVLRETKIIDKNTSGEQRFRSMELTGNSKVEDQIPTN